MKRLTKRAVSVQGIYKTCCVNFKGPECELLQGNCERCSTNDQVWERLATYEDAEEQGRLHIAPCKNGTPIFVHVISPFYDEKAVVSEDTYVFGATEFVHGEGWFLTRAEAEAALAAKGDAYE